MKFPEHIDLNKFLEVVEECRHDVLLISNYGDQFNLKSLFSRYIAIGRILDHKQELELYCHDKEDEAKFLEFFHCNPDML